MDNKEYNIAKGHIAELIVDEILIPKKGKVDNKYYVEIAKQLHTLELDDGEDAYRELMLDLDPDNVHIEEKYVMRGEDDEEVDKITKQLEEYAKEHPEADIGKFN